MANDQFDNDIPKITLDHEDREAYRRSRMPKKTQPTTPEPSAPAEKKPAGGFSMLALVAFVLGGAASAGCYWLYQQNQAQSATLTNAQQRIEDLERRLSATGEEMDQSAVALQVKVNELAAKSEELWNQMDKLWASAWRRNQSEIKALEEQLTSLNAATKSTIDSLQSDLALSSTNLAVLQEQLEKQAQSSATLQRSLAATEKADTDLKRQYGDIQAKLIAMDQVNSALTRRVAELESWRRSNATTTTTSPAASPSTTPATSQN